MFILVAFSIVFIWLENDIVILLDKVIWFIFVFDFSFRLYKSESKWGYIKSNPFDLIAIVPFDAIFRLARLARLFRIIRLFSIGIHYLKPFYGILKTNGLDKIIAVTFCLIFILSIPIQFLEPNINTYQDALWWSIVTSTTVGYGDISPQTIGGRIIAVLLMIFGIGLIGMITGSIATYFIKGDEENNKIVFLKNELSRINELTNSDIDVLIKTLESFKHRESEQVR
ncbi:potassium channel family protein [Anaerobacillus sp. CMMVII]|nr:potassium channel family protein [Anaerobacillus sp. CMMVII]